MPAPQPTKRVSTPRPARMRDVAEVALAVVAVEDVGVAAEMGFENVQVAVGVEVADADAHARLLLAVLAERDAALEALLGERAVAIVAEEQAGRGVAGDVDVGPAVAIEIGRGGGQRVARLHGRRCRTSRSRR